MIRLKDMYPSVALPSDVRKKFLQREDNDELLHISLNSENLFRVYGEISLDDIDKAFVLPNNPNIICSSVSCLENIELHGEDDIKNNSLYHVVYKEGKFISAPKLDNCYNSSLPLLKIISMENPDMQIPPIAVSIANYPFKKNDISPELTSKVETLLDGLLGKGHFIKSYIWIDINKNVSAVFKGKAKDINGIPTSFNFRIENKEELERLYREISILSDMNNIDVDRAKAVVGKDKTLVWIVDGEIVSSDSLEEFSKKNEYTLQKRYEDYKKEVITVYNRYYELYNKYWSLVDSIFGCINFLEEYNSKGILKRVVDRKKKVVSSSAIPPYGANICFGDLDGLKEKILFSRERINFIDPDISFDDVSESLKILDNIKQMSEYIDGLADALNKKIGDLEKELSEMQGIIDSLRQRKTKDIFKDRGKIEIPIVDFEIKVAPTKYKSEVRKVDHEIELLDRLQVLQSALLSDDEKLALMIYKALFYYPINRILSAKRKGGCTPELIEEVIQDTYADYKNRIDNPMYVGPVRQTKYRIDDIQNGKRTLSYDEFKGFVLGSTPLIETALKKITVDEDITLYRVAYSQELKQLSNHFLSTSIDPEEALCFLKSKERKATGTPVLYKIKVPAGSPLILYSTELFSGEVDHENPCRDLQKEVLIDALNFNFNYGNTEFLNGVVSSEGEIDEVALVEVNAVPIKKLDDVLSSRETPKIKKS